jgi:hypothetical protein
MKQLQISITELKLNTHTKCKTTLVHGKSTVQSSLLLLLHHRLFFFITGMLSSGMLKLVIVAAHMADIDLQIAQNYVQQMNQHPVNKACLMLCLTLD